MVRCGLKHKKQKSPEYDEKKINKLPTETWGKKWYLPEYRYTKFEKKKHHKNQTIKHHHQQKTKTTTKIDNCQKKHTA